MINKLEQLPPRLKRRLFFTVVIFSGSLALLVFIASILDILYGGQDGRLAQIYNMILNNLLR